MLYVTNRWRVMQGRCQWAKTQSKMPGWLLMSLRPRPPSDGPPVETAHPSHLWYALEGCLSEGRQSTRPIRHSGGDDTSSRWHGRLHKPWPCSCNCSRWQGTLRYPPTGSRASLSASTRVRGCIGLWQLPRSQADRAGHESPGEDWGRPRQTVSIDDSQFGFVPSRGITDAIFVVRQLQKKYLAAHNRLYMAFVDLEAVDRGPRKVTLWALRKLEDRIVRLVQGINANARSCVRVG